MTDTARVILWGRDIGAVTWVPDRGIGVFQYTLEFACSGIEVALMMPLGDTPFEFPSLSWEGFMGLSGMLADSLPDRFGTTLVDAWLSLRGANLVASRRWSASAKPALAAWARWNFARS